LGAPSGRIPAAVFLSKETRLNVTSWAPRSAIRFTNAEMISSPERSPMCEAPTAETDQHFVGLGDQRRYANDRTIDGL
jgi:hypothetical protein